MDEPQLSPIEDRIFGPRQTAPTPSLQMEVLYSGDHLPQSSTSGSPPTPDFSWVSLLWQRGFQHRNPQVRQAVLTSFFDHRWDGDTWLAQIPKQFVLGPLWKALDDPVQHPGFGESLPVTDRR